MVTIYDEELERSIRVVARRPQGCGRYILECVEVRDEATEAQLTRSGFDLVGYSERAAIDGQGHMRSAIDAVYRRPSGRALHWLTFEKHWVPAPERDGRLMMRLIPCRDLGRMDYRQYAVLRARKDFHERVSVDETRSDPISLQTSATR